MSNYLQACREVQMRQSRQAVSEISVAGEPIFRPAAGCSSYAEIKRKKENREEKTPNGIKPSP